MTQKERLMRFSLMCLGLVVALSTLKPAAADQPSGHADAAKQEIAELKQLAAKLSTRIESLERTIQGQQEPAVFPTGSDLGVVVAQAGFETEPEKADGPSVVSKTYKVADLVVVQGDFATAYLFEPVIRYIETHIAPEQWGARGGPGAIAPYRANVSLVISATEDVHKQISDWLEDMRAARQLLADFDKARFSAAR